MSIGKLANEILAVVRDETVAQEKLAAEAKPTIPEINMEPNEVSIGLRKIAAELRRNPDPEVVTTDDLQRFIRSGA